MGTKNTKLENALNLIQGQWEAYIRPGLIDLRNEDAPTEYRPCNKHTALFSISAIIKVIDLLMEDYPSIKRKASIQDAKEAVSKAAQIAYHEGYSANSVASLSLAVVKLDELDRSEG